MNGHLPIEVTPAVTPHYRSIRFQDKQVSVNDVWVHRKWGTGQVRDIYRSPGSGVYMAELRLSDGRLFTAQAVDITSTWEFCCHSHLPVA